MRRGGAAQATTVEAAVFASFVLLSVEKGRCFISIRLRMKIKEGVESGLCGSCEHARIMTDFQDNSRVLCEENQQMLIPRPLKRCTDYQGKGTLSRWEMEKIAWTLNVKGGRILGFIPPKKDD